jgi:hypothetical protein
VDSTSPTNLSPKRPIETAQKQLLQGCQRRLNFQRSNQKVSQLLKPQKDADVFRRQLFPNLSVLFDGQPLFTKSTRCWACNRGCQKVT